MKSSYEPIKEGGYDCDKSHTRLEREFELQSQEYAKAEILDGDLLPNGGKVHV